MYMYVYIHTYVQSFAAKTRKRTQIMYRKRRSLHTCKYQRQIYRQTDRRYLRVVMKLIQKSDSDSEIKILAYMHIPKTDVPTDRRNRKVAV